MSSLDRKLLAPILTSMLSIVALGNRTLNHGSELKDKEGESFHLSYWLTGIAHVLATIMHCWVLKYIESHGDGVFPKN